MSVEEKIKLYKKDIEGLKSDYFDMKDNFEVAKEEIDKLNYMIVKREEKIDRLDNIITELEKYIEEQMKDSDYTRFDTYDDVLDKLKELKGSDKE